MHKPRPIRTHSLSGRQTAILRLWRLLFKRVWLPRIIYEALPLIYICAGCVALAAALFLPGWTWILPWALVFGFAALHLGIGIAALRHKVRRTHQSPGRKKPV